MAVHAVTLNVPETVYQQIRKAAEKLGRPVSDVLLEAVTAASPAMSSVTEKLRSALAQMAYMSDAALWQAARATMSVEHRERLEALHLKQQRSGLMEEEQTEEQVLLALYRETVLIRAQAAALLRQRGYDVSDHRQFSPLSWVLPKNAYLLQSGSGSQRRHATAVAIV